MISRNQLLVLLFFLTVCHCAPPNRRQAEIFKRTVANSEGHRCRVPRRVLVPAMQLGLKMDWVIEDWVVVNTCQGSGTCGSGAPCCGNDRMETIQIPLFYPITVRGKHTMRRKLFSVDQPVTCKCMPKYLID